MQRPGGSLAGSRSHVPKVGHPGGFEVAVQHSGVEVQTVWPYHCAALRVHLNLREKHRIIKGREDSSLVRTD